MHFDQRTQGALREAGLDTDEIAAVSESVVEATRETAGELEAFFDGLDTVHSDMDIAHSSSEIVEHTVEYIDLYTHADDLRGYLKFDGWGVYVEGGRVLTDDTVELTLGPTVHDRVKFSTDPDAL
ncbi:DUF7532 family protein [Halorientalis salina]|uniref:DUF7532 family protein n=1 Tax=Halorientalis salina TaxID=2932266 RepID=UPI0010AD9F71|nr:hypothetical protein [Halorientalis salina]